MNKQTEALKLALEALEQWETGCGTTEYLAKVEKATPLIRKALAEQPAQQEPIYQYQMANGSWIDQAKHSYDYNAKHGSATVRVVYPSPQPAQRTWVGLSHDEYDAICDKHYAMSDFDFLEAIEAKLKEKNT